MQWIVWDLAAVAIIAGCVYVSARRGFIRVVLNLLSYVIAAFAANRLARPASLWLYENVLGDFVKGILTGSLRSALSRNGGVTEFVENVPFVLRGLLADVPADSYTKLDLTQNAARVVDVFVETSLREHVIWLIHCLVFLFFFLFLAFLVTQIARLFSSLVDRIPLVGTVNTVLGGAAGAVQAIVVLVLIVMLALLVITLTDNSLSWVNLRVLEDSYVVRVFYRFLRFQA